MSRSKFYSTIFLFIAILCVSMYVVIFKAPKKQQDVTQFVFSNFILEHESNLRGRFVRKPFTQLFYSKNRLASTNSDSLFYIGSVYPSLVYYYRAVSDSDDNSVVRWFAEKKLFVFDLSVEEFLAKYKTDSYKKEGVDSGYRFCSVQDANTFVSGPGGGTTCQTVLGHKERTYLLDGFTIENLQFK